MIPDRIIEQGTLTTDGPRTAVEVRLPWYRALPGSCIAGAKLSIDGVEAPADVAALADERPRVRLRRTGRTRPASGGSPPTPRCSRATCPSEPTTRARGRRRPDALHPLHHHRRRRDAPHRGARHQDHEGGAADAGTRHAHPGRHPLQLHPRVPRPRVRPRGPDPQGRRRRLRPRPRDHRLLELPRLPPDRRRLRRLVPRPGRRGRPGDDVARGERRYRHPPRSPAHARTSSSST